MCVCVWGGGGIVTTSVCVYHTNKPVGVWLGGGGGGLLSLSSPPSALKCQELSGGAVAAWQIAHTPTPLTKKGTMVTVSCNICDC